MKRLLGSANLFRSLGTFDDLRVHNHKAECTRRHRLGLQMARRAGCSGDMPGIPHFGGKDRRPVSGQPGSQKEAMSQTHVHHAPH